MFDLGQVEGFEMMPEWMLIQLEAQEFETFLVETGYYKTFDFDIEEAA
jgi:hypothetical protein